MAQHNSSLFAKIAAGKFTYLLASLALVLLVHPFLEGILWAEIALDVFFSLLLFSALYAVSRERGFFLVGTVTAAIFFILRWWFRFSPGPSIFLFSSAAGVLFFTMIVLAIIGHVFRHEAVTGETISGAICAYFLIAVNWAFIFSLLESLEPQSFKEISLQLEGAGDLQPFLYFSLVTVTTLGYGDITPVSSPARFFAAFEAVLGQLYLTVLVARLVGLYGFHGGKNR